MLYSLRFHILVEIVRPRVVIQCEGLCYCCHNLLSILRPNTKILDVYIPAKAYGAYSLVYYRQSRREFIVNPMQLLTVCQSL